MIEVRKSSSLGNETDESQDSKKASGSHLADPVVRAFRWAGGIPSESLRLARDLERGLVSGIMTLN